MTITSKRGSAVLRSSGRGFSWIGEAILEAMCGRLTLTLMLLPLFFGGYIQKAVAAPDLSSYELVFNDEFEGYELDEERWTTRFFWGPFVAINGEEQYYVDSLGLDGDFQYSPFSLLDGVLSITAVPVSSVLRAPQQPFASDPLWSSSPDINYHEDYDENTRNYLSGILTSADSYNVTHGYFEARLRFPEGKGLWPAFWLLNSKYVERFPEIDIVEFLGHKKDTVHHTLHYIDPSDGWRVNSSPTYETNGSGFTTEFHTYGVAWDPTRVRFYVDGELVREVADDEFLVSAQSMYLILNLAVGGNWPGSPDNSTSFPASFEIDYVRAYEQESIDTITQTTLNENYELMFSDEFNGDSLDVDVWNTAYLWGPYLRINNERQVYIDSHGIHVDYPVNPFEVSGGSLKIHAAALDSASVPEKPEENDPVWFDFSSYQKTTDYGEPEGWTPEYSSGLLTSYDSFKFVNGYAEARIKTPVGSGLWPAFWLLNGYYVGPSPEMDIMEAQGEVTNRTHHSYHYKDNQGTLVSSATTHDFYGSGTDDYHVYGFQWDSQRMVWYVDGIKVKEIIGQETSKQLSYILLNLAVGGNFVGAVDRSAVPASMEVDWVRVWQISGASDIDTTSSLEVGELGGGIAVSDEATGDGYFMYSQEDVAVRFSGIARPNGQNASHLIAVRFLDGGWQYNNNSGWYDFSPQSGDRLLAEIDFQRDIVVMLNGQEGLYNGIRWGFESTDLSFISNEWKGKVNVGEFGVVGSSIIVNPDESDKIIRDAEITVPLGELGGGVAVQDDVTGLGYMMYTMEDVLIRFSGALRPHLQNARHLIVVRFHQDGWQYNNNSKWSYFSPEQGDRLVARLDFTGHEIDLLAGEEGMYEGVRWGYENSDISLAFDQWKGVSNPGEFGVVGTELVIDQNESDTPVQSPLIEVLLYDLGGGIAVTENAVGDGYVMYSEENVLVRFSGAGRPHGQNSRHLIAVRFYEGEWQYNNNSAWYAFTLEAKDRLVAEIDFSNDKITMLAGEDGIYQDIRLGYEGTDVELTSNSWKGQFNPGEYGVSGTYFTVRP